MSFSVQFLYADGLAFLKVVELHPLLMFPLFHLQVGDRQQHKNCYAFNN